MAHIDENERLRYLDAASVEHSAGTLAGFEICTDSRERLGSLAGVVVEPSERRVRYFVVGPRGWKRHRYLVPAERLATLDPEDGKIYIDAQIRDLRVYDPDCIAPFSEDDAIEAMFASRVA